MRFALRALLGVAVAALALAAAYRFVNPPVTLLMLMEWARVGEMRREWRPLERIDPALVRAVIAAEDARFCDHGGFDVAEIRRALSERERGRMRGASTISQQTAKNVFLWPRSDWTRKGLEAGFTVVIETLWGKRRIMEVYLNVAEFAPGVFGAEAAARHWYGKPASELTRREAARLAAILPSPRSRNPVEPSAFVAQRARAIAAGADTIRIEGRDRCVLG